jgi:hypothetical protein
MAASMPFDVLGLTACAWMVAVGDDSQWRARTPSASRCRRRRSGRRDAADGERIGGRCDPDGPDPATYRWLERDHSTRWVVPIPTPKHDVLAVTQHHRRHRRARLLGCAIWPWKTTTVSPKVTTPVEATINCWLVILSELDAPA